MGLDRYPSLSSSWSPGVNANHASGEAGEAYGQVWVGSLQRPNLAERMGDTYHQNVDS